MTKVMRLWDIVFINVIAVFSMRWLPIAAAYGASSVLLWIVAITLFSIPLGLIAAELATTWSDYGGMYVWVREAFGEAAGFIVAWFYWVNVFFYYPVALTFIAVIVTSIINPELARNKLFICSCVVGLLWLSTFINICGMKSFSRFSNLSGIFGVLLPFVILVALGFGSLLFGHRPISTDYSWSNWLPKSNFGSISVLMFSMVGLELTPVMAVGTKNPQKNLSRAIFISAILVASLYIIGTVVITFILSPEKIGAVSGVGDALFLLGSELHIPFLAPVVGGLIVFGSLGGVGVWIVAPIKILLESCKDGGALPKWFTKINEGGMPARALLVQAIVATLVIVSTSFLPSVNAFFETLAFMAVITIFIPYIFVFCAFIKLREKYPKKLRPYRVPGGKLAGYLIAGLGLFSVFSAIFLPLIFPPSDLQNAHDILFYRFELTIGPVVFAAVGCFMYKLLKKSG